MKKSIYFTRDGLFIILHQQQWHSSCHSPRVVQDPRHFFWRNYVDQNIPLALELASSCQHPDARWLTEVCAGKGVTTKEDGKRVFLALLLAKTTLARFVCMDSW